MLDGAVVLIRPDQDVPDGRAAVLSGRPAYATVTWDQLHRDARTLADDADAARPPFRGIVAITRGGLIPAAIVARELDCRLIESVSVLSYDEDEPGRRRAC